MTGRRSTALAVLTLLLAVVAVAGDSYAQGRVELNVDVTLDRDTIGMDEQAIVQVVISGPIQDLPEPRMPTLPMFEVYSGGRSSNINISNGVIESSVTYRYILSPTKPGSFPIESISVVHQNRRFTGNPVTLTVLNRGNSASPDLEQRAQDVTGRSKDYFLEASVDDKNPFVGQQVTFTLKFYVAVRTFGSPQLTEATTTGFWTELLGTKGPYQQQLNNRTYKVIERSYALFPTKTGELTIGKAVITTTVASQQRTRTRDPFDLFGVLGGGQEINLTSNPIKINVRPLPDKGRPDDFTGTIGRFSLKAEPSKREVEVNQPVSLNISITGVGNIKSVAEPVIPELPDFRVYRASSQESTAKLDERIGGTKTFEEVFIPKVPGDLEIPSITFSFFDPEAERYRTLRTDPVKLHVIRTEGYNPVAELPYASPDLTISSDARDIRYIKMEPGDLAPPQPLVIGTPVYLVVNALPVLALFASIFVRRRREKLTGDVGYARARLATKAARKRLAKARGLARIDTSEQFFAECSLAVLSFIADKINISPHGLTTDKVAELLGERGADRELIDSVIDFLRQADFARYAASAVTQPDMEKALSDAEHLMVRMGEVRF